MKKQLIFIIMFMLLPMANIYSKSVNLTGDTIAVPGNFVVFTAENVTWGESVDWKIVNGGLYPISGIKNINEINEGLDGYTEWFTTGPTIDFVKWSNVAGKGRISYTVRNNPAKQGYADVEILSVIDSQVDSISVGNFNIYSDVIYIPKGESGTVNCSAHMIYPACRGGSETPVTKFKWQFPASLGGGTIEGGSAVSKTYDANSGDGEKIIVTPVSLCHIPGDPDISSYGTPRSFTIKRFEGVLENRNISGTETFNWENLIVKNVSIFPGANVSLHGNNSVLLLPEFYAQKGSYVSITTSGINRLESRSLNKKGNTKNTADIGSTSADASELFSQNYPNPCTGNTTIDCCLPENIGEAFLCVVSSTGQLVRNISISERGSHVLNLDVSGLSSGLYLYYVVADGKMLGTKRMVITNR